MTNNGKPTGAINFSRRQRQGRYADVIDVCSRLAEHYGSTAAACAQLVREHPLFAKTLAEIRRQARRRPKQTPDGTEVGDGNGA